MIDLHPTKCNLCGGDVVYTSNSKVYQKEFGNGNIYYCTNCHAFIGVNKDRPDEAIGLLADHQMRILKKRCRSLFDEKWKWKKTERERKDARREAYKWLAKEMEIPEKECNFGYFTKEQLLKVLKLLS